MKNNKHPHHDLIVELISDTSKQVEMITGSNSVVYVEAPNVISDIKGLYKFRIKPREFIKGHWYPCIDESTGRGSIKRFNGRFFFDETKDYHHEDKKCYQESDFCFVGKSLGEIKFNE